MKLSLSNKVQHLGSKVRPNGDVLGSGLSCASCGRILEMSMGAPISDVRCSSCNVLADVSGILVEGWNKAQEAANTGVLVVELADIIRSAVQHIERYAKQLKDA